MEEYEFMGPWLGPVGIVFGLPFVCYVMAIGSSESDWKSIPSALSTALESQQFFTLEALWIVLAWFFGLIFLHLILPGLKAQGVKLRNGQRLEYKLNALTLLLIVYTAAFAATFTTPYLDLSYTSDNWLPLLTASTLLSFGLSIFLYAYSHKEKAILATGGQTLNAFYNYFIGRELNPRIGRLDLKEFCELYPGLIGWAILNLGMACKQWGDLGRVTNSMVMVNVFQFVYVFDGLWFEKSILTTMDITTDGFGFMLAFGDLTWVPFIYSIQAKYLVDNPVDLPLWFAVALTALNFLGYAMFRGANSQKDTFRRDPNHPSVKHLKTLKTDRGTQLIVSGWWGVARHTNYTGDWLMGVAWCAVTGFGSPIPYFYALYFAVLLIHRDLRDGHACQLKYGRDWDKYCAIVPYRFIPYIY